MIARLLLFLVLANALVAAPLAYRLPAGEKFELLTVTDTELPIVGKQHIVISARCQVEAADATGMRMKQAITRSAEGKPDFRMEVACKVTAEGRISDITGVDLNDPRMALMARNAAMGLPKLPNEEVQVGSTWEDERPMYLPKVPVPGIPDTVRLAWTYKVTQLSASTATIAVGIKEANGEKVKVNASGTYTVNALTGKPVASKTSGQAEVRVLLKKIKVPFTVDVTVK